MILSAAVGLSVVSGCAPQANLPGATQSPQVAEGGWPMAADGRVDLLIVGSDSRSASGVDDGGMRTDSIVLVSIETATGKLALFNFPRNLVNAPLDGVAKPGAYAEDKFPAFLGYLWVTAAVEPDKFPGAEGVSGPECASDFECARGWRALTGTIQRMAGLQVEGVSAFNLNGFVSLIDNLPSHGVWLDVRDRVVDDSYINSKREPMPVDIEPGCQLLSGEMLLAYARSRRQDSDFERVQRQQHVIRQLLKQSDPVALLPNISAILDVVAENTFSTLTVDDLANLAELGEHIDTEHVYGFTFGPNQIASVGGMAGIAAKVAGIFEEPLPDAEPTPAPGGAGCPPVT